MSRLFARECWVLETTLSQEECVRRLKPKVRGIMGKEFPTPEQPLYGAVTSSGFAVQFWPRRPGYTGVNPFYFRGVFIPGAAPTTIQATYGVSTAYRLFIAGLVSFFLLMGWRILPIHYGMPASLQAFFGTVVFFIVVYCYRGIGRMNRFAMVDREPIIGTVADILEARISKAPETVS
jgi:hypothetical protein